MKWDKNKKKIIGLFAMLIIFDFVILYQRGYVEFYFSYRIESDYFDLSNDRQIDEPSNVNNSITYVEYLEMYGDEMEYMPLGSVIRLKDSTTKRMIIGYIYDSNGQHYNYICSKYPIGVDLTMTLYLIESEYIEYVYLLGYQEKGWQEKVERVVKKTGDDNDE